MIRLRTAALGFLLATIAAPAQSQVLRCAPSQERALDRRLPESSGAAWSGTRADVFWTVNDGRDGELFAVDTLGRTVALVDTDGPRLRDVEALAAGPCPSGRCIYLADTGDNGERRDGVAIHRIPEPDLSQTLGQDEILEFEDVDREVFRFVYPDGPVDVEGMFILPGEGLYLVAKGRRSGPAVFRYAEPFLADETVTVEEVGRLGEGPASFMGRLTGASDVPDLPGYALVRSYQSMELVRLEDGRVERVPGSRLNLRPLGEPQGEAVAVAAGGLVVLTSEEGPFSSRAEMRILRCTFNPPASR